MSGSELEFSIAKLDCKPGDTVLFKVKHLDMALQHHPERVAAFEAHLQTFMPVGTKSLLIDSDMEVTVLSGAKTMKLTQMSEDEERALLERSGEFAEDFVAPSGKV